MDDVLLGGWRFGDSRLRAWSPSAVWFLLRLYALCAVGEIERRPSETLSRAAHWNVAPVPGRRDKFPLPWATGFVVPSRRGLDTPRSQRAAPSCRPSRASRGR